ncbi:MAG: UvrD-helicase domain-containing protein [Hydrogenophaga sp.]|uniref:UvrD-helicase domain-containing protein n=1 Tax=Hydrogenophaga sp. TaxID=1904254 RepID=UPI001D753EBB|nr:UvrD-helicase domain-containing protein [Hydrogenophaga sp.]MBX3611453.1 UvrD-helicase domain-containing protein [Hydrogenophaga sp.]
MSALAYRIDDRAVDPQAFYACACDPARSVAVEACAGAGKTWMLVSRILRALLDGVPAQDILAITFTKKAAAEMRERLQQVLSEWSELDDDRLCVALSQRGMSEAQARERLADARGLRARLHQQGRPVQLRTFHSWFAALLRGAPLAVLQELGLPTQYELQENDDSILQRLWPRFYRALAGDEPARDDFFASVADIGRHQTLQALRNAVGKRVEFQWADAAGAVDNAVRPLGDLMPAWAGAEADPVAWLVRHERFRAELLAASQALGGFAKLKKADTAARELETAVSNGDGRAAIAALLTAKGTPRKLGEQPDAHPAVQAALARIEEALQAERQQRAWVHHQRMARLTRVLLRVLAELKLERGWVDMNDVEGAARRLLGDAELSGWMQQRLDARVRHLLIDEFQDTNPLQWQALYGWLSAYAGAGAGEAPSVFIVGDPKQSIYRFRRAEPQVFRAAQAFVVQGLGGARLSCDHTRRCAIGVIDALNTTMQRAEQAGEYGETVGAAFRTHTTASDEPGAVLALPQLARSARARVGDDGDNSGAVSEWRDSLNTPRHLADELMSDLEARQAADWIASEIAAGHVKPDDVMVLARKRERLGWMHQALRERGIASEQPDKLELGEAPAVQDVIALVDALVSPGHDLSLARALRSPIGGWSDDDLAALAMAVRAAGQGAHWWTVLLESAAHPDALPLWQTTAERWQAWQQALLQLPPHDALSLVYREGQVLARYAQAVPPAQRRATIAQLQALLAQALGHEGGRFLTAYRFVRAIKAGGIALPALASPGAVRLLTIHGAKGLEADTVMLLDTDAGPARADTMGVLVDWPGEAAHPRAFVFVASEKRAPLCAQHLLTAEQAARSLEELNALYVAMTRAARRLVVSSFEPGRSAGATSWWQRLQPLAQSTTLPTATTTVKDGAAPALDLFDLPTLRALPEPVPTPATVEADVQTRFGRAVHQLLQWCPTPADGFDWGEAHRQAVAASHQLEDGMATQALEAARRMVRGEAAWAWDDRQVEQWGNEVELLHAGQVRRLDRLLLERASGTWWVLDFKTHDAPHTVPAHREQMAAYRAAVAAIHPGEPLRLAFINPTGRLIEWLGET